MTMQRNKIDDLTSSLSELQQASINSAARHEGELAKVKANYAKAKSHASELKLKCEKLSRKQREIETLTQELQKKRDELEELKASHERLLTAMPPLTAESKVVDKMLPDEVEHRVHEFLRIAEVCALQGVSKSWHVQACEALRRTYRWDLTHVEGVDAAAHEWLEHVSKASVKIRSLRLGDYETATRQAAASGFAGAVEILISHCPSTVDYANATDGRGMTPLHHAATNGHRDVVELLVAVPSINVNAADTDGCTPLNHAAENGHRDVVELLVTVPNINVNAATTNGWTPLHCAANNGHCKVIELLVAMPSIDVNAGEYHDNNYDRTPLHLAADRGHRDGVELLVAVPSINVNAADGGGWTPLHCAADSGHCEVVKLLVAMPSIDVNAENNDGQTPVERAAFWGRRDVVKVLLMTMMTVARRHALLR